MAVNYRRVITVDSKDPISSEQVLLQQLANVPERGGRFAFIRFLNDALNERITQDHAKLTESIRTKAQSLEMSEHPLVRAVLRHIENNRIVAQVLKPRAPSISGCYPFRR